MNLLLSILLFFFMVLSATAQTMGPRFYLDLASFKYDENQNFVELYYAFPRSALTYKKQNGEYTGSLLIYVGVHPRDGGEPIVRIWRVPVVMADTSGLTEKMLIGTSNIPLAPGRYVFQLTARDEATAAVLDSLGIPFEVRNLQGRNAGFSDIELCSSVKQISEDPANIFYKNTLEVIPNPPLLYGKSLPVLMYYMELYQGDLEHYQLKTEIVSSYGRSMSSRSQRKTGKHPSRVEVGTLPVGHLPTGAYTFIVSYADTSGVVRTSQTKTFYVFNPDVPLDSVQARLSAERIAMEFTAMPEDELDDHFAMVGYIATVGEKRMYGSLQGAEAKRKFLTSFWDGRDTDTSAPGNEAYDRYMKQVLEANERFRTPYKAGWKTDRGRVFILYGRPDYIERSPGEGEAPAMEIWTFDNLQGGVEFVFSDKGGFNEYQLVHSTMRDEISNPNWQQLRTR